VNAHQQNPDGSWSPATPEPIHPGIDWEIGTTTAVAHDGWVRVADVHARWPWLLRLRVLHAHRALLRAGHKPLARR